MNTATLAAGTRVLVDGRPATVEAAGPVNGLGQARVYVRVDGDGFRTLLNASSVQTATFADRDGAANRSGCDTCINGCSCEIGQPGCEHWCCWSQHDDEMVNTCAAFLAALADA